MYLLDHRAGYFKGAVVESVASGLEVKYRDWVPGLAMMRDAIIEQLSDADLDKNVGGESLIWGQLIDDCAEMQRSYLDAFSTLDQRWSPPRSPDEYPSTVAEILDRFHSIDHELATVLDGYSGNDWDAVITRPDDTKRTRRGQLEIYAQFMLIFLGKASVYARAHGHPLPPSLLTFVG